MNLNELRQILHDFQDTPANRNELCEELVATNASDLVWGYAEQYIPGLEEWWNRQLEIQEKVALHNEEPEQPDDLWHPQNSLRSGLVKDFSFLFLSEADLTGADFSKADFDGADLSYADLSGSSLKSASMIGADLSGTNLSGTDLWGVDMFDAVLTQGTNMQSAYYSSEYSIFPESFYDYFLYRNMYDAEDD